MKKTFEEHLEFKKWLLIQEVAEAIGWEETFRLLNEGKWGDFVQKAKNYILPATLAAGMLPGTSAFAASPSNVPPPSPQGNVQVVAPQQNIVKKFETAPDLSGYSPKIRRVIKHVLNKYPITINDIEVTTPGAYYKKMWGKDWNKVLKMAADKQQSANANDSWLSNFMQPGMPQLDKLDDEIVTITIKDPDSDEDNQGMCRTEKLASGEWAQYCFVRPERWKTASSHDIGGHELGHTMQPDPIESKFNPVISILQASETLKKNPNAVDLFQYWAKPNEFVQFLSQLKRWYHDATAKGGKEGIIADGITPGARAEDMMEYLLKFNKDVVHEKIPNAYAFHAMGRWAKKIDAESAKSGKPTHLYQNLMKLMNEYLPQLVRLQQDKGTSIA